MSTKAESQVIQPRRCTIGVNFNPIEFILHGNPEYFKNYQPVRKLDRFPNKDPDSKYECHQAYVDPDIQAFTFELIIEQHINDVREAITFDSTFEVDMHIKVRMNDKDKDYFRFGKPARIRKLREFKVDGTTKIIVVIASALFNVDGEEEAEEDLKEVLHRDRDNFMLDVVIRGRGAKRIGMETRKPGRPGNLSFRYRD